VGSAAQAVGPPLPPVVPLNAPSERPEEPVTSGLPMGAGPGPEVLGGVPGGVDDIVGFLQGVYAEAPNEDVRRLLEYAQQRQEPV
jgi:hypothetical protein